MSYLRDYLKDGAGWQARVVLSILQGISGSDITIGRWENGREQGYVAMKSNNKGQLNICWFEHRNSNAICALKWEQATMNTPNIDSIPDDVYPNKWHNDYSVGCEDFMGMAKWIKNQFNSF